MISPTSADSKDAFDYEGIQGPPEAFNSRAFGDGLFDTLLSSGRPSVPHGTHSFLQFDLTGVSIDPGETARLNLWVESTTQTGFGANPSAAFPVHADAHEITSDWTATGVTWPNEPTSDAAIAGSALVDGINKWISIDVTALVQSWLATPSSNRGMEITQPDTIFDTNVGQEVVSVYASSFDTAGDRPQLEIVAAPEPASALMLALATGTVMLKRRR